MYTQRSFWLKDGEHERKWFVVDAKDKVVGRLASEIAKVLRGKHNPQFTPNTDSGDFVVVINAEKVRFTGKKWEQQKYYRHSGHIGNLRMRTAREQLDKAPEKILMEAVRRMLPKSSLGAKQLTKCKVYAGEVHPHEAQAPAALNV